MRGRIQQADQTPRTPRRKRALLGLILLFSFSTPLPLGAQQTHEDGLDPSLFVSPGWSVPLGTTLLLDASQSTHQIASDAIEEVRFTWSLGDGSTKVGEQIAHIYTAPGDYDVRLRMEVFRVDGTFVRAEATGIVEVTSQDLPRLVRVIDLDTGYALSGDYGALLELRGQYLLVGPDAPADSAVIGPEGKQVEDTLPAWRRAWSVGGGLMTLDDLLLYTGSLAFDLEPERWRGIVSVGTSTGSLEVPLGSSDGPLRLEGHELDAIIDRIQLASFGIGLQATERLTVHASAGLLYVTGSFVGSERLSLAGETLPMSFTNVVPSVGLGFGIQIGRLLLSIQALLPL